MSTKKLIAQTIGCCDSTTNDVGMLLLSSEEKSELDHRLAEDDAAPDDAVDWESIKAEAQARWQKYTKKNLGKRRTSPTNYWWRVRITDRQGLIGPQRPSIGDL